LRKLTVAALLLMILGCSSDDKPATADVSSIDHEKSETRSLNEWLDREFSEYLDFSPMAKTRLGDKSDYDKLDDVSIAMQEKRLHWRRESVQRMKAGFDRASLDKEGKRSFDLWIYMLDQTEEAARFRYHRYIFGRRGPHTSFPRSFISYHRVDELSDMQAYISRLNQGGRYLRQYLTRAQHSAEIGVRAPYFDYETALSQIARVLTGEPFDHDGSSALWADVTAKVSALVDAEKITKDQSDALMNEARQALVKEVKPAYDEITVWLKADLANVSENAKGAWSLPDGKAYYDFTLAQRTTLALTADEIHDTGLSEVARIRAEMEQIKTRVGFEGSLEDFFTYSRDSEQFYFPNTDKGRSDYLALANTLLDEMKKKLPEYFGMLPRAPLIVKRVEAFREQAGAAAHYSRGTKDGSRPGVFYAHLADMNAVSKARLENLAYHEGLPGHHMQISIQQELEGIPRFRTYHGYTAFSEGWGLYAELLGKDMGFYEDPYADFGRLSGEMWRAIRLVVDTGIHARRWTEQQAIDYAIGNSARPAASVNSEVRRYFNMPGQATAYKIGMLKILELRKQARQALGDNFDIREFHDAVLGSGPLPMPMLKAKIDEWVADQKG
jgi:uncharacterized protein (DUF885 family)